MFVPVREMPGAIEVENCPSSRRHSIATCSNPNPIKKYMPYNVVTRDQFLSFDRPSFGITREMKLSIHVNSCS